MTETVNEHVRSVRSGTRGGRRTKITRQLLVWLHVVSSVSWMSQAAALAVLLFAAAAPGPGRIGAIEAAELLDTTVVLHSANVSAATGFLLSATTAWGFLRHRWVTAKLVMTIGALYLGIAVLSARMGGAAASVRAGGSDGVVELAVVAALMASAFGVQVWLSVAKPGRRSGRGGSLPTAPAWMVAVAVVAPLVDVAIGIAVGNPIPVVSLVVLAAAGVLRRRATTRARRARGPAAEARTFE